MSKGFLLGFAWLGIMAAALCAELHQRNTATKFACSQKLTVTVLTQGTGFQIVNQENVKAGTLSTSPAVCLCTDGVVRACR